MKYFTRIFFLLLVLLTSFRTFAQIYTENHTINTAIKNLKNDKDFKNASISFFVQDVNSGEVISSLNPDLSLAPASTQKLLTTATALEILGSNYKFKTRLEYSGKIDKQTGILNGNIIIKGGGDPALGSKYFSQTENMKFLDNWARAIYKAGIKFIDGKIIGDASLYGCQTVPPKWTWEDMGNYFGAGPNGLTVHDNLYTLYFNTSSAKGGKTKITKTEPEVPGLKITNNVKSDAVHSDLSYIFGAPYSNYRIIEGRLPLNKTNFKVKGSLPDPALFTAQSLKKKLKKNGISSGAATTFRINPDLRKNNTAEHHLLYTTYSPELKEIIRITNFKSINLFAEHLYKQTQLKLADFDKTETDKDFIKHFWRNRGLNTQGMFVFDGSGLSRYNGITAEQLVFVLKYMKTESKNSQIFYESIPSVGKEGTVKNMCKGTYAVNNMRAKSGSLKNVRAYAGYVKTKSGRELAFSVIMNNFTCSSAEARKKTEKLLAAIAEFNR
ncbi:MAG: D-alanyl-D-alanine carboxypeptidase/D-alanyl-D-alanine-endopeptidase [Chlorobi bacterium]|nr:D-alanyl-D-alanine carboxypeptidase/D-alanyl-D-alanine-endopeptidase [Chlorobiota bacterium]